MAKWDVAAEKKFHKSKSDYRRPSAWNYIRKTTSYFGSDLYLVSTAKSYDVLREARVGMSKKLADQTSLRMNTFIEKYSELFKEQEDEILKEHIAAVGSTATPNEFIEILRSVRKDLDSGGSDIQRSLDTNKMLNSLIHGFTQGRFDSILEQGIQKTINREVYTNPRTVAYLRPKSLAQIGAVTTNTVALYNNLLSSKDKHNTTDAANAGLGLKYLQDKMLPLVQFLITLCKQAGIPVDESEYSSGDFNFNRDIINNLIGMVYESNEYTALWDMQTKIGEELSKKGDDAGQILKNVSEQYLAKAIGNMGGTQKTKKEQGTADLVLSLDGPNPKNFIRIDAKSASFGGTEAGQSDYTFTYKGINIKDSFIEAIKSNPELEMPYYMVLGNIMYYARLALNEEERQAAINMYFSGMSEKEQKNFLNKQFGGEGAVGAEGITANVPTLITISTRLERFSTLVGNMGKIDMGYRTIKSSQIGKLGLSLDQKLLYNRKLSAYRGDQDSITRVRETMNHFGSEVAKALYGSTKTVSLNLRIKI